MFETEVSPDHHQDAIFGHHQQQSRVVVRTLPSINPMKSPTMHLRSLQCTSNTVN
ncbi:hypothetical protein Hanom_Chr04g00366841 [Helianthus anomalus]